MTNEVINFFSDGPITQYRQRKKFYHKYVRKGAPGSFLELLGSQPWQGSPILDWGSRQERALVRHTSIKLFYIKAEEVEAITDTSQPTNCAWHNEVASGPHLYPRVIKYRDVSCICNHPGFLDCPCFGIKSIAFPSEAAPICPDLVPVHTLDGDILHKWCIVRHDTHVFPGIIQELEESDVYI